jgi:hypothetical protein
VSEQTFYTWKKKHGGLEVADAKRLRQREEENARLKRSVADQALHNQMLRELLRKNWIFGWLLTLLPGPRILPSPAACRNILWVVSPDCGKLRERSGHEVSVWRRWFAQATHAFDCNRAHCACFLRRELLIAAIAAIARCLVFLPHIGNVVPPWHERPMDARGRLWCWGCLGCRCSMQELVEESHIGSPSVPLYCTLAASL